MSGTCKFRWAEFANYERNLQTHQRNLQIPLIAEFANSASAEFANSANERNLQIPCSEFANLLAEIANAHERDLQIPTNGVCKFRIMRILQIPLSRNLQIPHHAEFANSALAEYANSASAEFSNYERNLQTHERSLQIMSGICKRSWAEFANSAWVGICKFRWAGICKFHERNLQIMSGICKFRMSGVCKLC